MALTETANDILRSFTDKGEHWAEACTYCAEEAMYYHRKKDRERFLVWRDYANEIDQFCRSFEEVDGA